VMKALGLAARDLPGKKLTDRTARKMNVKIVLMVKISIPRTLLAITVGVGVVFSVLDYRDWKRAETINFGKGSDETAAYKAAQTLVGPYTNDLAKIRMRYPDGWEVIEDPIFNPPAGGQDSKLVVFNFMDGKKYEVVKLKDLFGRATVTVSVQADNRDLNTIIDKEAVGTSRDREFINTDATNITLLTWIPSLDSQKVRQLALAKKNGKVYRMEVICEKTSWEILVKTFEEIYKSWVLI